MLTQTAPTPSQIGRAGPQPRRARRRGGGKLAAVASVALGLGALAVTNHLLARRSEARHPPRGRFITVDGVRLHYLDQGSGPAVVLLHGNGVSSEDFVVSGVFDALAMSRRVIAFDRPGFGYSERPRSRRWTAEAQARLLLRAIDALQLERPLVVGHSWGSFVAANMGVLAPDRLSGLVLMSGYYRPSARLDAAILAGPAVPIAGDLMRFTLSPLLGRLMTPLVLRRVFAPAPVSEQFRREYPLSLSLRPGQLRATAAEAGLMVPEAARLSRRLSELTLPTLILAGRQDRIVSFAHQSEWLSRRLTRSRLRSVDGAGHMVHHSAPGRVTADIEGFQFAV